MQFVCSGFPPQVFLPDPLLILLLLVNTCACSLSGHRENDVNIILIFKGEMINFTSNARLVSSCIEVALQLKNEIQYSDLTNIRCLALVRRVALIGLHA